MAFGGWAFGPNGSSADFGLSKSLLILSFKFSIRYSHHGEKENPSHSLPIFRKVYFALYLISNLNFNSLQVTAHVGPDSRWVKS